MTANPFWSAYSAFEDELRRRFHEHRIYNFFSEMTDEKFRRYLLQIGFIAREFVKWYEIAKLGLTSESAKEVVRAILRDEIPQQGPTHQDDRLHDLGLMFVTRDEALNVKPTIGTQNVISVLYHLIRTPQEDQDLRIMITLRVAGEVLVAEQYGHIVDEMKRRFNINPEHSRFYAPHYMHDMKGGSESVGSAGHTDRFDDLLASMITDEHTLKVAKEQAVMALHARGGIHDQFLTAQKAVAGIRAISMAVAAVVVALFLGVVIQKASVQYERERWATHVAGQSSGVMSSLTFCDEHLLNRFRQFHIAADLEKIGTPGACLDTWIGP